MTACLSPDDLPQNWGGSSEMIDDTHVRMYNDNLFVETGAYVSFGFQVSFSGATRPEVIAIDLNGQDACGKHVSSVAAGTVFPWRHSTDIS